MPAGSSRIPGIKIQQSFWVSAESAFTIMIAIHDFLTAGSVIGTWGGTANWGGDTIDSERDLGSHRSSFCLLKVRSLHDTEFMHQRWSA